MKQAKSILFRHIIDVERRKKSKKKRKEKALTSSSFTMPQIKGIYRSTDS